MHLIEEFNESYKATKGASLLIGLYASSNYGSNSFCFHKMEELQAHANDAAPAMQKLRGL